MSEEPSPDEGQSVVPRTPSRPARLPYSKRALWTVGRGAVWLWGHKLLALDWAAVFFWRCVTLLGVIWLVYDRIYEADATLSAPASDPKFLFEFPFAITNNSHVFTIRNVRWACEPIEIRWPVNMVVNGGQLISGTTAAIGPGQTLNFECAFAGLNPQVLRADKVVVEKAALRISLEYDADFFGLFTLHRRPSATMFTWSADASNPQWIKGNPVR